MDYFARGRHIVGLVYSSFSIVVKTIYSGRDNSSTLILEPIQVH